MAKMSLAYDAVHQFVLDWMGRSGIDPADVISYELTKRNGDLTVINLTMAVRDPAPIPSSPDGSPGVENMPPRLNTVRAGTQWPWSPTTENPNIVKEG